MRIIMKAAILIYLVVGLVPLNTSTYAQDYVRFVSHFKWNPDGTKLAIASNLGLEIYDPITEEYFVVDTDSSFHDIAWSPDGSRFASINLDEQIGLTVQVWDAVTYNLLNSFIDRDAFQNVQSVDWSPIADEIALTGLGVRIWNVNTGMLLNIIERTSTNETGSVSYNFDGTRLAFLSWRQINIWDLQTDSMLIQIPLTESSILMSWSPNGSKVAAINNRREIHIFDVISGQTVATLIDHEDDIGLVQWEANTIASAGDGTVRIWDATSFELLHIIPNVGVAIGLSPDGTWLAYETAQFTHEIAVLNLSEVVGD